MTELSINSGLMPIISFQKLVTVSIWMFNVLLLNKSHGMLP